MKKSPQFRHLRFRSLCAIDHDLHTWMIDLQEEMMEENQKKKNNKRREKK